MDFDIVQLLHTSAIDIQDKPNTVHVGHYGRPTVTCFHLSVSMLLLTRRRERVLDGSIACVEGYTGVHSLEAMVVPKLLIAGSCSATKSMPLLMSAALEMRLC
jgi:hypothetical protein